MHFLLRERDGWGEGGVAVTKMGVDYCDGVGFCVCFFTLGWIVSPKPEAKFLDSHIPTCHHLYDCGGGGGA